MRIDWAGYWAWWPVRLVLAILFPFLYAGWLCRQIDPEGII